MGRIVSSSKRSVLKGSAVTDTCVATAPDDDIRTALMALYPRLWRYALGLTGSHADASDLVQESCHRALEKAALRPSETPFDRWMFRLTHRVWLNEIRARTVRRGAGVVDAAEMDLVQQGGNPEMGRYLHDVLRAIMSLPESQRSTVILVYVEEYSYREAAEILGIPVGTVMSRLSAARQKLATETGFERGDLA